MATTSPLSALSSPDTFYTANASSVDKSTTASSPAQGQPCPYRAARHLQYDLKQHCHILLEEQLYLYAINLLNSIVAGGVCRQTPPGKAVAVPPSTHLALLLTLTVHPIHTTRAEDPKALEVSTQALDYLINLLTTVGPINAGFKAVTQFTTLSRFSRRQAYHSQNNSDNSDDDFDRDDDHLKGKLANEASLWNRGQDFWSVVGWAFKCSTLHPQRWRHWKAWLGFMLDLLDRDWSERERIDVETHEANGSEGDAPVTARRESIIAAYLGHQNGRLMGMKLVLRSIFADGNGITSSQFREVFDKELRGPRKRSGKRKRDMELDLENDKFGDYFDDESLSSGVSEPPTPEKPRDPRKGTFGTSQPSFADSIELRLRLFKLVSAVTYELARRKELNQLYEEFASSIKLLPLQSYSLFVTQRPNPLLPATHTTTLTHLFHILLPSSFKDPSRIDPDAAASGSLSTALLEHCYIGYPANTVAIEDNAKLSLVVESALQLLWRNDMLEYSDALASIADKGIAARSAKSKKKRTGKGKTDANEALAETMLKESAERIGILMKAAKEWSAVTE